MKILFIFNLLLAMANAQASVFSFKTDLMCAIDSKDLAQIEKEIIKVKAARMLYKELLTNTILYIALQNYPPALWSLIQAGADVNAVDDWGKTPLFKTDRPRLMQMFIKARAEIKAPTKKGDTAVDLAAKCDEFRVARLLLEHTKTTAVS